MMIIFARGNQSTIYFQSNRMILSRTNGQNICPIINLTLSIMIIAYRHNNQLFCEEFCLYFES